MDQDVKWEKEKKRMYNRLRPKICDTAPKMYTTKLAVQAKQYDPMAYGWLFIQNHWFPGWAVEPGERHLIR